MMKPPILPHLAVVSCLLLTLPGCDRPAGPASPAPDTGIAPQSTEPARPSSFKEVTSQLDPGGSVFVYLALNQWLEGLSGKMGEWRLFLDALSQDLEESDKETFDRALDLIRSLVRQSGLESISGVGLSAIEVEPDLHRTRFILHHAPGESGFLVDLFGRQAHELAGLKMLPTTTALAAFGDLNLNEAWRLIDKTVRESGLEEWTRAMDAWPEAFEKQAGLNWSGVLDSLGGELGVILNLDDQKTFRIPIEQQQVAVPEPSLLLAVKVTNPLIYDHVAKLLAANPDVVSSSESGLTMTVMPLPIPLPLPFKLAVASNGEYLFVASSPELVRTVHAAFNGASPGASATAEFQALARHLDLRGNSFSYVDKRFSQALLDIQKQVMQSHAIPEDQWRVMENLLGLNRPTFSLSVGAHSPNGWSSVSVGNQDPSSALVAAPAVAVAGVFAGLALPALAQARSKAQTAQEFNQLKQLGLAALLYADEHGNGTLPPAASWCDALDDYLPDKSVFKARSDPGLDPVSFAFNTALGGVALGDLQATSQTVLLFEATGAWNLHGGRDSLPSSPRHRGGYIIGFADGSVRQVDPLDIDDLKWSP